MRIQSNAITTTRYIDNIDISTLTVQQRKAYDIVSQHFSLHHHDYPLQMLVLGTAGTGKSYLIQALAQLLGDKCLLTATTGIAAFHIGGITLHSALLLPVQGHNCKELSGQTLGLLQHKLKDISMLGQNMMAWVDKKT